jgi:molybdopterin molybdotransferase
MGDLDLVPQALVDLGCEVHFHGLAMKPGKPTLFASRGQTLVFGLPGNPVSTLVQFDLLVRPALSAVQGLPRPQVVGGSVSDVRLPLAEPFERRNSERNEYVPGRIEGGRVVRVRYKGSGHLSALAEAELFFRVDRGVSNLSAGEHVRVRFFR